MSICYNLCQEVDRVICELDDDVCSLKEECVAILDNVATLIKWFYINILHVDIVF